MVDLLFLKITELAKRVQHICYRSGPHTGRCILTLKYKLFFSLVIVRVPHWGKTAGKVQRLVKNWFSFPIIHFHMSQDAGWKLCFLNTGTWFQHWNLTSAGMSRQYSNQSRRHSLKNWVPAGGFLNCNSLCSPHCCLWAH